MHRTVTLLATFALAIVAQTAHASTDDAFVATFRREFTGGCMETAKPQGRTEAQVHAACACLADHMVEGMGVDGLHEMLKADSPTPAVLERMTGYAQECAARPELQPGAANAPTEIPAIDRDDT